MTTHSIDIASQKQGASANADRAVVNGAGQAVSALRASVPSAIVGALLLAACQAQQSTANTVVRDYAPLPVVTDPATGCQYLGYTGHGLTPRLDRSGKTICGGVK